MELAKNGDEGTFVTGGSQLDYDKAGMTIKYQKDYKFDQFNNEKFDGLLRDARMIEGEFEYDMRKKAHHNKESNNESGSKSPVKFLKKLDN